MKVIFLILMLFYTLSIFSNTYSVKQDGSGDFLHIQEAVESVANYDRITVYPGVYYENIDFNGKTVLLVSLYYETNDESYISNTIIDGGGEGAVLEFSQYENESCQVNGFTIRNGSGCSFHLTPDFSNSRGGGIYVNLSSPSLRNLIIENNRAYIGGGIFFNYSESLIENLTIRNNTAYWDGGGICLSGSSYESMNFVFNPEKKCNIYNNRAGVSHDIGSICYRDEPQFFMVDTITVLDGDYSFFPTNGSLNLLAENEKIQLIDEDLYVAPWGDNNNSGFSEEDPLKTIEYALKMIKADTINTKSIFLAPGIYSPSQTGEIYPLNCRTGVSIIGSGMGNTIIDVEGIRLAFWQVYDKNVTIKDLTILNAYSYYGGGVIIESLSSLNIENVKIENCKSVSNAGIMCSTSDITANNIFINNCEGYYMLSAFGFGREFKFEFTNIAITNCGLLSNSDFTEGGMAIMVFQNPSARFSNCFIYGNTLVTEYFPTGMMTFSHVLDVSLNNITEVENNINFGGHSAIFGNTNVNIVNSIMRNDCDYGFVYDANPAQTDITISHSIVEDYDNCLYVVSSGSLPNINVDETVATCDPGFTNFGGIFDRYHLRADSYCIDNGDPDTTGLNLPIYDFLGDERIFGDRVDIGCFEYIPVVADNGVLNQSNINLICYPNPLYLEEKGDRLEQSMLNIEIKNNEKERFEKVELAIYNIKGQLVRSLVYSENLVQGKKTQRISESQNLWDLKDKEGRIVGPGVYLLALKNQGEIVAKTKCLILK